MPASSPGPRSDVKVKSQHNPVGEVRAWYGRKGTIPQGLQDWARQCLQGSRECAWAWIWGYCLKDHNITWERKGFSFDVLCWEEVPWEMVLAHFQDTPTGMEEVTTPFWAKLKCKKCHGRKKLRNAEPGGKPPDKLKFRVKLASSGKGSLEIAKL